MNKKLLITALALGIAPSLMAGSFQLNLQGIRQFAMGGGGTAKPWDASTIFYNPAGMSRLGSFQIYASGYYVSPNVSYSQSPATGYRIDTERRVSTPFAVYLGGPVTRDKKLGLGVGIFTPFGSNINWGNDWRGRYIVQNITLQSVQIQPTISYQFNEQFSIGAGFNYGFGSMEINRALPVNFSDGSEGNLNMEGNAQGWGFNIGAHYKPSDAVELGLSYRYGMDMKVDNGKASFSYPQSISAAFPTGGNTGFSTVLPLPHIVSLGIAYNVNERLTLQGDLIFANWARYKSLDFTFDETTAMVQNTSDLRNYKNTLAVRLGGNYKITDALELMAGFAYDPTPTSNNYMSPDAVDGNRIIVSGGLAYTFSDKVSIMAACQYTTTPTRKATYSPANFSGAYQIKSFVPSLGMSVKL